MQSSMTTQQNDIQHIILLLIYIFILIGKSFILVITYSGLCEVQYLGTGEKLIDRYQIISI